MNDPPGVAVIESVDDLVHEELDLLRSHAEFVLGQIFLEVVIHIFKHQLKLLFVGNVDHLSQPK